MEDRTFDWQSYIPWRAAFESVMDQRFYTLPWLDEEITSGRARFWGTDDAAIVATIRGYPTGAKEVHGLIAAGELEGVIALIAEAEAWGCAEGAIVASIASRAGWCRALRPYGYDLHQVEIRKELSGGHQHQEAVTDLQA